jgi:hypothetical protein
MEAPSAWHCLAANDEVSAKASHDIAVGGVVDIADGVVREDVMYVERRETMGMAFIEARR